MNIKINNIYYISNVTQGGSYKYLLYLQKYSKYNFTKIKDRNHIMSINFNNNDLLLLMYLLYSDINFYDIINIKKKYGIKIIVPVHDNYFIQSINDDKVCPNITYDYISGDRQSLLDVCNIMIFPSYFIFNFYKKYCRINNYVVVPHIDFINTNKSLYVPKINDSINVGIITQSSYYKGNNLIEKLILYKKHHNNIKIMYYFYNNYTISDKIKHKKNINLCGEYDENDIYEKIERDNIHLLLFLNNYPETYSYAFTKGLNTNLYMLCSEKGAFVERSNDKCILSNNNDLFKNYDKILNLVYKKQNTGKYEINLQLNIDSFYKNYNINL